MHTLLLDNNSETDLTSENAEILSISGAIIVAENDDVWTLNPEHSFTLSEVKILMAPSDYHGTAE